jgi:hypothetical protein
VPLPRRTVQDCRIHHLPVISASQGNITPVHAGQEIPFEIRRLFYVYDIPGGDSRGAHAHRTCAEFIVPVIGSFDVFVDDGVSRDVFRLDRSYRGLYLPPMIWLSYVNFSSGSIALVFASNEYDEADYLRNYDEFVQVATADLTNRG